MRVGWFLILAVVASAPFFNAGCNVLLPTPRSTSVIHFTVIDPSRPPGWTVPPDKTEEWKKILALTFKTSISPEAMELTYRDHWLDKMSERWLDDWVYGYRLEAKWQKAFKDWEVEKENEE